jgi:hypothetical protein
VLEVIGEERLSVLRKAGVFAAMIGLYGGLSDLAFNGPAILLRRCSLCSIALSRQKEGDRRTSQVDSPV